MSQLNEFLNQVIELLNKVEWTPRLITELVISGFTIFTIFVNWIWRGFRLRRLNKRLAVLEKSANTISPEECAEIKELLSNQTEETDCITDDEIRETLKTVSRLQEERKALTEKVDELQTLEAPMVEKYQLESEESKLKLALSEIWESTEDVERVLNAGLVSLSIPKIPKPEESQDVALMAVLTAASNLDLDEPEDLELILVAANKAGGGRITKEVVAMVEHLCDAEFDHPYITKMLNTKAANDANNKLQCPAVDSKPAEDYSPFT